MHYFCYLRHNWSLHICMGMNVLFSIRLTFTDSTGHEHGFSSGATEAAVPLMVVACSILVSRSDYDSHHQRGDIEAAACLSLTPESQRHSGRQHIMNTECSRLVIALLLPVINSSRKIGRKFAAICYSLNERRGDGSDGRAGQRWLRAEMIGRAPPPPRPVITINLCHETEARPVAAQEYLHFMARNFLIFGLLSFWWELNWCRDSLYSWSTWYLK